MKRLPWWRRPYGSRRILEIGPGHNPFHGVTHVLERDVSEGRERSGQALEVPGGAKLIVGDAVALPFAETAFDFVYASHVLEHVDVPEQACREIMRVGRAGYIETPSPFLEQGLALADQSSPSHWFHRWFVFAPAPHVLAFEPKSAREVARFCSCRDGQFLHDFYASLDFSQAQHCFRRASKTTIFYWNRPFQTDVRRQMVDCRHDGRPCRFSGMRRALIANCNDLLRASRVRRLPQWFPQARDVFRKYGHYSLLIH